MTWADLRHEALQGCGPRDRETCHSISIEALMVQTRWLRSSRTSMTTSLVSPLASRPWPISAAERAAHTRAIEEAVEALAAAPPPSIAAIHGYALAGGAELALACDLRVAGSDATFGFPEVKIGIFPGAGGVLRLPRLVGDGAAKDLLFTGRQIDASEAFRLGLIDRLTATGEAPRTARQLAIDIAANAPLAVRAVKRALTDSRGRPHQDARQIVNAERAALDATADYAEGLAAFAEKRAPRFSGR